MDNVYYKSTKAEILKRLTYLNKGKYVDFFRESTPFMLALYITYFGLLEELVIERDSKDYDIKTRFTKHIDEKYLKKLFPGNIPIEYIKKEKDANSYEWILSTLRNGIIHNGVEVDYKNRKITVKNDGFINNLECVIPFEWFENLIHEDIVKKIQLDNYKYHIFQAPFKPDNIKHLKNYDDINDYIEKELNGIVIEISLDKTSDSETKIEREEFIEFTNEVSRKFYNEFYEDRTKINDEEIIKLKEQKENELTNEKNILSNEEYEKLLYFKMFKEYFTNKFSQKYPNYTIDIKMFENKNYAESLFKRGKDRVNFFKIEKPQFQGGEIAWLLSCRFNHDKVLDLEKVYYLCTLYDFCSKAVTTDYNTDKYMEKIVNSRKRINYKDLEENYAESVKQELEKTGVILSYDDQITENIIWGKDMYDEDIYKRCQELTNKYNTEEITIDYNKYIKDNLKKEFAKYYEEKSREYLENGVHSDQVLNVIKSHNLYALNNAKGVLIQQRDNIIEALLYILGINTFVMNKETYFKDLTEKDYSFMDTMYFKGYSHDLYKDDVLILKQKLSELRTKQKRITKNLNNLQQGVIKVTEIAALNKIKQEILNHTSELVKINSEISNYTQIINSKEVIDKENIKLERTSNSLCANIIRNCFAHCNRVHIIGRDKNGEVLIKLTDYDLNGELSGFVETNLTSLIDFFKHDIFKNELEKQSQKEQENIYSKKIK